MTDPTGGAPPPAGPPPSAQPPAVPPPQAPPPAQPPPMTAPTEVGGAPRYAEWWKRVVATIVDSILLSIVNQILSPIFGLNPEDATFNPTTGQFEGGSGFFARFILANLIM